LTAEEGTTASKREKILFAQNRSQYDEVTVNEIITMCNQLIMTQYQSVKEERCAVRNFLKKYVVHYQEAEE